MVVVIALGYMYWDKRASSDVATCALFAHEAWALCTAWGMQIRAVVSKLYKKYHLCFFAKKEKKKWVLGSWMLLFKIGNPAH